MATEDFIKELEGLTHSERSCKIIKKQCEVEDKFRGANDCFNLYREDDELYESYKRAREEEMKSLENLKYQIPSIRGEREDVKLYINNIPKLLERSQLIQSFNETCFNVYQKAIAPLVYNSDDFIQMRDKIQSHFDTINQKIKEMDESMGKP